MNEFERVVNQTYLIHLDTLRYGKQIWKAHSITAWTPKGAREFVMAHWRDHHGIIGNALSFLPFARLIILHRLIKEPSVYAGNVERFNSYGIPSKKQGGTN